MCPLSLGFWKYILFFVLCFSLEAEAASSVKLSHEVPSGDVEVDVTTTLGMFKLDLFEKDNPQAVNYFLNNIKAGLYTGTIFHRIINGFILQGGGYDISFLPKKDHFNQQKFHTSPGKKNTYGSIAFAGKTGDDGFAFTQFFINLANNENLDRDGYQVFGVVFEGLDVIQKLAKVKIGQREGFDDAPYYPKEVLIQDISIKL